MTSNILYAIIVILAFALLLATAINANKETSACHYMRLCADAKHSGNIDWQDRCDKFYETGDVEDIETVAK